MEEIRLFWPNGGMGNTIFCLLHLGTKEFYLERYSNILKELPNNGNHWHSISDQIVPSPKIVLDHFGYDKKNGILVGSSNRYFVKLLSWHKWEGLPNISYGEDLELLVKFLNMWYPEGGLDVDFEILDFFENSKNIKKFIKKIGLTVNDNFDFLLDKIKKNNKKYYNEIKNLEHIVDAALQEKNKEINLTLYQQAIVMSMIEIKIEKSFRLVHNSFKNTNIILSFLEK
jgi:hypothetical protein